nr:hypothetical protein CFP56_41304 [Quercus suber]
MKMSDRARAGELVKLNHGNIGLQAFGALNSAGTQIEPAVDPKHGPWKHEAVTQCLELDISKSVFFLILSFPLSGQTHRKGCTNPSDVAQRESSRQSLRWSTIALHPVFLSIRSSNMLIPVPGDAILPACIATMASMLVPSIRSSSGVVEIQIDPRGLLLPERSTCLGRADGHMVEGRFRFVRRAVLHGSIKEQSQFPALSVVHSSGRLLSISFTCSLRSGSPHFATLTLTCPDPGVTAASY